MGYILIHLSLLHLVLSNAECVVVNVEQGQLRGEILQVVTGDAAYISFKGIPYARPPIGDLRFNVRLVHRRAPQPPQSLTGIRNATQHGPVCVQPYKYDIQTIVGSEDCLYLNVYTPCIKPNELMAVMFYIYGGGFVTGSGNVDRYGPDYLIIENVVIVTINYRLGPVGFLALKSKDIPGNAALKDQVAAMKWVQKNIAAFGGDPNKVTVMGHSVGAASVGFHNVSPLTKGLYKRAVMMSGGPINDWVWEFEPKRVAFRLGQQLGFWTQNEKELVHFLRTVPADQLVRYNPAVLRSEEPNVIIKQLTNTPVVETVSGADSYLPVNPLQALKTGKVNDVEVMTGHTDIEGIGFLIFIDDTITSLYTNFTEMVVPRKILENIPPAQIFKLGDIITKKYFGNNRIDDKVGKQFLDYISDSTINYGLLKYAGMFSKLRTTYMYKFSIMTDFPRYIDLTNKYGINGPTHEDELYYLFYPHDGNITITKDSEDYKLVRKVCSLYANFAKYGNPTFDNSLGVKWPKYDSSHGKYLDINTTLSVGEQFDAEMVSFWDSVYKAAGKAF